MKSLLSPSIVSTADGTSIPAKGPIVNLKGGAILKKGSIFQAFLSQELKPYRTVGEDGWIAKGAKGMHWGGHRPA
jgi:hypothetical protein